MPYRTDDPVADAERYFAEQERRFEELPECDYCGERITDDYYWYINGEILCEECLNSNFRKDNE